MTNDKTSPFSVIGVGVAVCLACCAPLLLGFIGSLGIAGLASTLFIGAGGLVVAAAAATALVLVRRRRQQSACAVTPEEPIPVELTARTHRS